MNTPTDPGYIDEASDIPAEALKDIKLPNSDKIVFQSTPTDPLEAEIREKLVNNILLQLETTILATRGDSYHRAYARNEAANDVLALIHTREQQAHQAGYTQGFQKARDESFKEHMKVVDFYKTADFRLEKILFPDHCSSCHTEWNDNGFEEMPCCAKAPSNIRDSVLKWHKIETEDIYNRLATLNKEQE